MKEKTRKYLVLGQGRNDDKPFICYRTPNFLMPGIDEPADNQYSADNCLCSRKEAEETVRMLSSNFPEITYAVKKFLDRKPEKEENEMKERKYVVFGQRSSDTKPALCYGIHQTTTSWSDDTAENNNLTGTNCLMTKREAIAHWGNLQGCFPEISYAVKKFLD